MNLLKRLLAVLISLSLVPTASMAQALAKAPAPVAFSATVAAPSISAMPVIGAFSTPTALVPVLAAASLTPAALAPVAAAAATPVAVKPVLEVVSAKITASKPGSLEAASALETAYTGSLSAASADAVPGAPSALSSALKPSAAASSDDSSRVPSPRSPRSGKINVKLLAIIGGAVIVIGLIIGLLVHNGSAKNKVWEQSRAAQEVVKIESAIRSGDAETLFKIEAEARSRQKTSQDADAAKAKTLDAFDGLVALRGGTTGNAASTKPEQRPGGQLFTTWKNRLADAEAQAKQSGTIAPLARALSDLRAEIAKENTVAGVYAQDLRKFQAEVPVIGGAMGEQASKATTELGAFRFEAASEQGLHDQYYAAMRQIVADRLAATSSDFRASLERADRLSTLAAGTLSTLDDLADKVDNDFKTMAAERRAQKDNAAEAGRHTADPVLDAAGKPTYDSAGKAITQDNSQTWKDKAAQNAANAQAAAASAKANIEAFNRDVKTLRGDRAMESESLDKSLPKSADVGNPDWEHGIHRDLLEPWQLGNASTDFTEAEANDARARFGTAKGAVTSVQQTVDQRKKELKAAIDKAIDDEVARESKGW